MFHEKLEKKKKLVSVFINLGDKDSSIILRKLLNYLLFIFQVIGKSNVLTYLNVSYYNCCRVFVELAIPCEKPGPRVFEGFTVGFHPRSWEIVRNL